MYYICRILKKLGLREIGFRLLSLFVRKKTPGLSFGEAMERLNAVHPSPEGTCIRETPQPMETDPETDVDIIIPCYNAEKYMEACIDSVLTQETKHRCRIIAVDDGSTDGTGAILDRYQRKAGITVIHQENKGPAGARNAGLELSGAKYIFFLDADDMLCRGAVDALIDCADANGAEVVEGAFCSTDNGGNITGTSKHKTGRMAPDREFEGFACGKLYRGHLFENLHFPLGILHEDSIIGQILFPLLSRNGQIVYGISAPCFMYRANPRGITRSSVNDPRNLDALWIHLRLYEDRKKLNIADTQAYYEFVLHMVGLTYTRTLRQPEEVRQAIFVVWRDYLDRNFAGFRSEDPFYAKLEKAVRTGDYGKYCLLCSFT